MAKKTEKSSEDTPQVEPVETYYDEEPESGSSSRLRVVEAACEMGEQARDAVLERVPVEVTEHLAASKNELLKAGIALAEASIRKTDEVVGHARDLHDKKDA